MGKIIGMLEAINSKGDRVSGLIPRTNVNELNNINKISSVVRWAYYQYAHSFEGMLKTDAISMASEMVKTGSIVKEYGLQVKQADDGVRVSLQEAIVWVATYVSTGEKIPMNLAYVAQTGEIDGDTELKAHLGKIWNACLLHDYPMDMKRYAIGDGTRTNVDIVNRSVDTFDVYLTSTKGGQYV